MSCEVGCRRQRQGQGLARPERGFQPESQRRLRSPWAAANDEALVGRMSDRVGPPSLAVLQANARRSGGTPLPSARPNGGSSRRAPAPGLPSSPTVRQPPSLASAARVGQQMQNATRAPPSLEALARARGASPPASPRRAPPPSLASLQIEPVQSIGLPGSESKPKSRKSYVDNPLLVSESDSDSDVNTRSPQHALISSEISERFLVIFRRTLLTSSTRRLRNRTRSTCDFLRILSISGRILVRFWTDVGPTVDPG